MTKLFKIPIFTVLVFLILAFASIANAQETTPPADEGDTIGIVQPADESATPADSGDATPPQWYVLTISVIVVLVMYTQYTAEKFRGKSVAELSKSLPIDALPMLLNGASTLASLTKWQGDDKAVIEVGTKFGFIPTIIGNNILWVRQAEPTAPPPQYPSSFTNIADIAKNTKPPQDE